MFTKKQSVQVMTALKGTEVEESFTWLKMKLPLEIFHEHRSHFLHHDIHDFHLGS